MTSRQSIDRTPYTEYDLNQLVLSYLIHHGYTKTAFAFVKNTKSISDTDQEDTVTVRGTGMEQRTGKTRNLEKDGSMNTPFLL
jgi:hypothetical protein